MPKIPSLLEMLKAGVHFGHQRSRWHPQMKPFIFGTRNGVHIIDLDKTAEELQKALEYVKTLASQGKVILFVGTKKQAREAVKAAAIAAGMPHIVERWIGGLLTNFGEFKKRMKKYKSLKEMVATGEIEKYTKKEQGEIKKEIEHMDKYLLGLESLEKLPDALYIADVRVEKTAMTEAQKTHVSTVAVCDTNVNPNKVTYPIPSNDDAVQAIIMMANLVAEAVKEGKELYAKQRGEMEKAKPVSVAVAFQAEGGKKTPEDKKESKRETRALRKDEVV